MFRTDKPVLAPGQLLLTHDNSRWTLRPGDSLSLGRSRQCDLTLPRDAHLSRLAATVTVLGDCVLVRNESASKPLALRPRTGEDSVVEPGAATTSLPHRQFAIVFAGCGGQAVVVQVDARALTPASVTVNDVATRSPDTVSAPVALTGTQRKVLQALCTPLLTMTGDAIAPATYAEIGRALDLSPGYVRNVIKTTRETLAGAGVPGLVAEDATEARDDYRWVLARWAIRNGWVGLDDLESCVRSR